jgi:hypothetical protein
LTSAVKDSPRAAHGAARRATHEAARRYLDHDASKAVAPLLGSNQGRGITEGVTLPAGEPLVDSFCPGAAAMTVSTSFMLAAFAVIVWALVNYGLARLDRRAADNHRIGGHKKSAGNPGTFVFL